MTTNLLIKINMVKSRRLDCPAFLRHSKTGQTNRLELNLDGYALNGRSKTALHSAVVRSPHSRLAPFRCRFQNVRSVRFNFHQLTRQCAWKSGQHAERRMRKILEEGSHDLYEFKSGRLTPCILKVLMSAVAVSPCP
jgi:hypothetical protein